MGGFEYHYFVDFINEYGFLYLLGEGRIRFAKEIMNTEECVKHMPNLACDGLGFKDFVS